MSINSKMKAIADAIRAKTGGTDALTLDGMAEAVAGIEAGGGDDSLVLLCADALESYANSSIEAVKQYLFYGSEALRSISLGNCTEISMYAFGRCRALTAVDLPQVRYAYSNAFEDCSALKNVVLPSLTDGGSSMFQNCSSLESVSVPALGIIQTQMFRANAGTMVLKSVNAPSATRVMQYAFQKCKNLLTLDFPSVTQLDKYAFYDCWVLRSLVLRADEVCTLANTNAFNNCYHILGTVNSTYNPDGLMDGYIYVPDTLVDSYKAATNWSIYASQIKPLSEYVEVTA